MMPGIFSITIYRGAAYSQVLQFYVTGTTTPIQLTTGVRAEVRDHSKGPLVLQLTVTATSQDLLDGKIVISATAEETKYLTIHASKIGIIGGADELYAEGVCNIKGMIPNHV